MILDGAFGTMLQSMGLEVGADPADWNMEQIDAVASVHKAYANAGAEMVLSNTFGVNRLKYHGKYEIKDLVCAALKAARIEGVKTALDLGPTGKLLKPIGDLDFSKAVEAYAEVVNVAMASDNPPDAIFIETMSDTHELKAAIIAAKENSNLPIYATVALDERGKLLTGADVECVATLLEALNIEAYGFNCGLGPDKMLEFVERLAKISSRPIIVKPNAGLPRIQNGSAKFDVDPSLFAEQVSKLVLAGASIVGGCCGTTPSHIQKTAELRLEKVELPPPRKVTAVSSGVQRVELSKGSGLIIGERINPTGKKRLKEAYQKGDVAYILREAVTQVESGAEILDVNCGVAGLDESKLLPATVAQVESVVTCPIQIDTSDVTALELALRQVNGKALVNSVNGKECSLKSVLPLVKKYGGVIVALCLDESGIPSTSQGRIDIAKRILAEGKKYGFGPEDFVFDALTLAVSADKHAAMVTLDTVRRLTTELGVNTMLGVSNVSFGLPQRQLLNNAMYSLAKEVGLSAAIANPQVIKDFVVKGARDVLLGRDEGCLSWIESVNASVENVNIESDEEPASKLRMAVIKGLTEDARLAATKLIQSGVEVISVIEECIVPSLEDVGKRFESGTLYLPQLLMAADAAGAAFEVVRKNLKMSVDVKSAKRPIILATVKGDVHDIGKNIVRALLENYNFDVIDLGRDVSPERIVEAALSNNAMMVGLSALMTTTVGAMAETIRLLEDAQFTGKTVVGGAVVTQEYADTIGADYYAADAMRTVRIASEISKNG